MKCCKKCGHPYFHAQQEVRQNVIVDAECNWVETGDTYDTEDPYGPFECGGCSASADRLEDLVEEREEKE